MIELFDFKLRRYKKIRQLGMPLLTRVAQTVPRELFFQAAEDLRMLSKDKTIIMKNEDEVNFIMDRAIHDIPWPEQRWIEQICKNRIQDYTPEQQTFLKAYLQPYISLYEVLGLDLGRGVYLQDLFNNQQLFLMDINFGKTAHNDMLLATRIITLKGLNYTSGIAIPFQQEDKKRLIENFTYIYEKKKSEMTWEQIMRKYAPYFFIEYRKKGYNISFSRDTDDNKEKRADEWEDEKTESIPAEKSTKVSRNAPCPCGSGKKYKRCCLPKDEEKNPTVGIAWDYIRRKKIIESSDDFPVEQCLINSNWQELGIANIVVARNQGNDKLILGVFIVDIFCLGVKNTFCNAVIPVEQFENEILKRSYRDQKPVSIGINYAKEIIFGALEYARNIGFEPQEDFKLSKYVLGAEEATHQRNIKFGGPNGKPLYIAGPDNDYRKIVNLLKERLGENGFDFIIPGEQL